MIKIIRSSSLLILQNVAQRSIGVLSTVILARLLTPEDFGIVAIAMLVLWFSKTLCDASTESYILQQRRVTRSDLNSAWTLDLILKTTAFAFMVSIAGVIASLKEKPELTLIIIVAGTAIIAESLKNPIFMIYKRRQHYGRIVKLSIYAKIIGLCLSIPIAFAYETYWSLILGTIASEIFITIFSYKISSYRPSLSISKIADQWAFSKWLIPRAILGYFRNHLDTILVSGAYQKPELGAYNNMKYFAAIPMLQLLGPMVEPLHVELGKVGYTKSEFKYQTDITFKILSVIASAVVAIFFLSSESIISIVLGNQWVEYHNLFAYFSISTISFVFITQSFRILMVSNLTNYIFYYELISTTIIGFLLVVAIDLPLEKFLIIKIISETTIAAIFYGISYRITIGSTPVLNVFLLNGLPFACITIFNLLSLPMSEPSSALLSIIYNLAFVTLFLISFSIIFYIFMATKREKALVKRIVRVSV